MTLEQKLDLLLSRQITETSFASIVVTSNAIQATALGQGACKAVILRANKWKTYDTGDDTSAMNGDGSKSSRLYYGDSKQQTFEYPLNMDASGNASVNSRDSEIIFCKDLSDVSVRYVAANADPPTQLELQILIYR